MDALLLELGRMVVGHGAADGLDTLVDEWARSRGVRAVPFEADWDGLGRKAGKRRNSEMLAELMPDIVLAFPGGEGTDDMLEKAHAAGCEVRVIPAEREDATEVPLEDL